MPEEEIHKQAEVRRELSRRRGRASSRAGSRRSAKPSRLLTAPGCTPAPKTGALQLGCTTGRPSQDLTTGGHRPFALYATLLVMKGFDESASYRPCRCRAVPRLGWRPAATWTGTPPPMQSWPGGGAPQQQAHSLPRRSRASRIRRTTSARSCTFRSCKGRVSSDSSSDGGGQQPPRSSVGRALTTFEV